jgi:hypothetical protein
MLGVYKQDNFGNWYYKKDIYKDAYLLETGGQLGRSALGDEEYDDTKTVLAEIVHGSLRRCRSLHNNSYTHVEQHKYFDTESGTEISAPLLLEALKSPIKIDQSCIWYMHSERGYWYEIAPSDTAPRSWNFYSVRRFGSSIKKTLSKRHVLGIFAPKEMLVKSQVAEYLNRMGVYNTDEEDALIHGNSMLYVPVLYKKLISLEKSNIWVDMLKQCEI